MIEVEGVLIQEPVIENEFVCNLGACKGACCVQGEAGAPLEKHELPILDEIFPKIKPFMTKIGINTVEAMGTSMRDTEGDFTTPCVDGDKECAYVTWENGITKCAIEKAYEAGVIEWQKPISCHLYPIRITEYPTFDVLQYDRWHICHDACSLGRSLHVPVYKFLKAPLIRKYGAEWYSTLEKMVGKQQLETTDRLQKKVKGPNNI